VSRCGWPRGTGRAPHRTATGADAAGAEWAAGEAAALGAAPAIEEFALDRLDPADVHLDIDGSASPPSLSSTRRPPATTASAAGSGRSAATPRSASLNWPPQIIYAPVLGLCGVEDPSSLSGGGDTTRCTGPRSGLSPDILLLEEATNHLDLPGIEWLDVTHHDMARPRHHPDPQGGSAFKPWRAALLEQQESETQKLGRKIAIEEDWLRYGITARRTRNWQGQGVPGDGNRLRVRPGAGVGGPKAARCFEI
jgi:hypothetical protein